jgi:hypothetical protein
MTSTSVRGDRGAQAHTDTRTAGSPALRAASKQLLATVGNQVLKAAVDRAVGGVDRAADRLDAVAAGESRVPRATPRREPGDRPDHGPVPAGQPTPGRMGAAFSLVVHQAARILQLIRRLAQQLVAALARLASPAAEEASVRHRTGEPSSAGRRRATGGDRQR